MAHYYFHKSQRNVSEFQKIETNLTQAIYIHNKHTLIKNCINLIVLPKIFNVFHFILTYKNNENSEDIFQFNKRYK